MEAWWIVPSVLAGAAVGVLASLGWARAGARAAETRLREQVAGLEATLEAERRAAREQRSLLDLAGEGPFDAINSVGVLHHLHQPLEGLRAAAAIGDDTLQKKSQGYAVPESFTHGTSEQRIRWFRKGLASGDLREGDTFSIRKP